MIPKVSIIVPVYNAEKYITKCVDSIINQTLSDIEIILINDGSTDNSGNIIDEYARRDKRIVAIHQENSGPSATRNKGIKIARGTYIGFVDSDDYIEAHMYDKLYNLVKKENIQVGMCSYREIYLNTEVEYTVKANIEENKLYSKKDIRDNIVKTFTTNENNGFYSPCNKIYLREWILRLNIYMDEEREHGEDWWFNINLFNLMESYIYTNEVLYNYIHINENSLMFKYRENQFDLFLDGRLKLISIIDKKYINYNELNKRFILESSTYILNTIKNIDNRKKQKQLIYNVINNQELINCCKNKINIGTRYKFVQFLIKNRFIKTTYYFYKLSSKLIS